MREAPKNPGIAKCGPPDHHAVAACLREHAQRISRRSHVSVSDDRDMRDCLLHLPDNVPIRDTRKTLRCGARMYSDSLHADILGGAGKLNRRKLTGIPAAAHLDGYGNTYR